MIDILISDLFSFISESLALLSSQVSFLLGAILARVRLFFRTIYKPFLWIYKLIVLINVLVHFNTFIKENGWKSLFKTIFKTLKYITFLVLIIVLISFVILSFQGCSSATSIKPIHIEVLVDKNLSTIHMDSLYDQQINNKGGNYKDRSSNQTDENFGNISLISKMLLNIKLHKPDSALGAHDNNGNKEKKLLSSIENSVKKHNIRKAYVDKKKLLGKLNDNKLLSTDVSNEYNFFSSIDKVSEDTFNSKCAYKHNTICSTNIHRLDLIRKDLQYNVISDDAYFEIFSESKNKGKLKKTYIKIKLQGKKIFNNFSFPFFISKKLKLFFAANGLSVSDIDIHIYVKRSQNLLGKFMFKKKITISHKHLLQTKLRFLNLTNSFFILSSNRKKCRQAAKMCYNDNMFLKLIPLSKMNMFNNN